MQNLKCDICGKYLPLCRGDVIVNADYCENNHCYKIGYKNVPLFHCAECNESYLPEMTELFFREFLNTSVVPLCITSVDTEDIEWDDFIKFESIFEKRFNDGPFSSNLINFLFDPIDYFFIDGLEREHNIGFLTPVFFNIEVLLKNPDLHTVSACDII